MKKLGLDPARLSDEEKLDLMVQEPRLVRRPFLVVGGRLIIQPRTGDLGEILE